jgi:nicotinate-nucleotide adenylyltransferase
MPTGEQRPVGVLGGTFDPVHFGHLRMAEEGCERLGLAGVCWIPAGLPPHREAPRVSADHRLEMVRAAVAGNARFHLDDAEVRLRQPSYTVVTLERMRSELGTELPLVVLLGVDAFRGLPAWHRWGELFALAHLAVAQRPGYSLDPKQLAPALQAELAARRTHAPQAMSRSAAGLIVAFDMTPLAISATAIRALLATRQSARYLLPDPVLDYIGRNHLYSAEPHGR